MQKRILCINDISCMGKCSLTVALPVISAMGIEAVAMPTAILSAHTVFEGYTFYDTTAQMQEAFSHFDKLGESFDAIYTGYLGSTEQIELVRRFISKHPESLIITDPVMGDNGRLYSGFDRDYPCAIRELCCCSDVLLPNLTEACFIADMPYIAEEFSLDYLTHIAARLSRLSDNSVITGVREQEHIAVYTAHHDQPIKRTAASRLINKQLHGTGDVFASVFAGMMVLGKELTEAASFATEFTEMCILNTVTDPKARWYGLTFEPCLHTLYEKCRG